MTKRQMEVGPSFVLGLLMLIALVHYLKNVIKLPRPVGGGYAMPSNRAAMIGFLIAFSAFLVTREIEILILVFCDLALIAWAFWTKITSGAHTPAQLVWGLALGLAMGAVFGSTTNNK